MAETLIAAGLVALWVGCWLLARRATRRLHTAESVARELVKGLEDGTITLPEPRP